MRHHRPRRLVARPGAADPASNAELRAALWDVVVAAQLNATTDDPAVRSACERAILLLERGETVR